MKMCDFMDLPPNVDSMARRWANRARRRRDLLNFFDDFATGWVRALRMNRLYYAIGRRFAQMLDRARQRIQLRIRLLTTGRLVDTYTYRRDRNRFYLGRYKPY